MTGKSRYANENSRLLLKIEEETRKIVSKNISTTEVAIAAWDSMKNKPETYRKRIDTYKKINNLISSWMKESLKGVKNYSAVAKRLDEFAQICKKISNIQEA
jgi:hypothetical protein